MKALLHKHFTREGAHHIAKSKHHRAIAEHAGRFLEMHKAAKSDMEGLDEILQSYIDEHAAISDEHAAYAEHCIKCAKAVSDSHKAAGMGDELDTLAPMPEGLSRVTPTKPGVFAVPRAGMQPLPTAAENPLFQKVFGAGTDE
jgi:hypothetical protein